MVEYEENSSHKVESKEKYGCDRDDDVEARLLKASQNGTAPKNGLKKNEKSDLDRTTTEEINKLLRDMPLTEDMTCGFWIFKGKFFQRFANQTAYVVLYGLVGCIFSMTYAYFNGTITTIEKRFKIPSKNTGIISVGNDISQMMVSAVLSYYAGKGHRPRWIGFGLLTIVAFCLLTAAPHFLYGPGEDALALTMEFGATPDENATMEAIKEQRSKTLCRLSGATECEMGEGNFAPQVVLFTAQFISGIGGSLYYTLGVSYMDDNIKKSKTPALLSLSYFLRMLGPAIGYALASFCLRVYIAPQLHPVIKMKDPRWLGAWWMGWLIIGTMIFLTGVFLSMFPKDLPRAVARRMVEEERRKQKLSIKDKTKNEKELLNEQLEEKPQVEHKASFRDMMTTFKRLTTNKTLMYNNFSSVFYLFGYTPYWIFAPKYIEIQYRQSASVSSMVTGTVALAFSAVGVLLSGFVISRYKPSARYMAAWNVIVGFLTVGGIITYAFIGCPGNEQSMVVNIHDKALDSTPTCNSACGCDYVRYSPVCGENNMTYISPCHAGCKKQHITKTGKKYYYECSCIPSVNMTLDGNTAFERLTSANLTDDADFKFSSPESLSAITTTMPDYRLGDGGQAVYGACPVNCFTQFVTFLAVMCALKFIGATGRASNFLVTVRCVPEKDKTAAMGFGMMMMSMLAFIPSPIFFGWVLDRLCLVWGKTCTNKGNCWLYDPESLRYILNMTAAVFIAIGALFDCGVWYYVKDLKIFDEEVQDVEMEIVQKEEETIKQEI
ncbi:solute carrier organic anion transporter family member 74D [Stomoxys calcitrans]|uniref:solute carrier organic anion transporter family member 74D n=1 Tax=Stomoxys calcitrans TaxID=35570 RepID=UPI0027E3473B|nr:solute carrier organic anion transporter family member 74D [Stomoxys calcitrans]XP_059225480.1 solute carrier organic anion transporter family member 74D [Stomoxys calcitrans]XP_059225481.1 solute carrier organic anion transporter family member 74D [Stomoxys calcitrans]XP_059225482.1 solute carrier organic anion transporter family member 74D [Stomoxys calcitrans]XP_059225483.1 solute carrier organic anion transporter family member 74D [Stomoxys calcitrans]XP_059225484.1 solute carrier organ